MAFYLIDYENVRESGFNGIEGLDSGDGVNIFYSKNAPSISLDIISGITGRKTGLHCFKAEAGTKNALDFVLATYLGYLISTNKNAEFFIVTKDKGFDALKAFWATRGVKVETVIDCTRKSDSDERNEMLKSVTKALNGKSDPEKVTDIVMQYKTKQAISNAITKAKLDTEKQGEIYKLIKPLLKGKN